MKGMQEGFTILPGQTGITIDVLIGRTGSLWILHDRELPAVPDWVEFDPETSFLSLICEKGRSYRLDHPVKGYAAQALRGAEDANLALVDDGRMKAHHPVRLVHVQMMENGKGD